jgi:protein phosphatase
MKLEACVSEVREVHSKGPLKYCWLARTDTGLVRPNNEDALLLRPEDGIWGVCDGLGGHAAGEVASSLAVRIFTEGLSGAHPAPEQALSRVIEDAHRQILDAQLDHPEHLGMGTTASLLWLAPDRRCQAWIAHVGDSRIYRFRDGRLEQLTEDHSPVFRLYREGVINKQDVQRHPQKNLIERCLGAGGEWAPDVFPTELKAGDLFLLATDGLTDRVLDDEICHILDQPPFETLADRLVNQANDAGGVDNISVVLVRILGASACSDRGGPR